jgi:two-component system, NarL family, nitrate/nitrite response regulator NarL
MDGDDMRKGARDVINMIEVAVIWDDPALFEGMWAYAAREPDLDVRQTSTAVLLSRAEPRPDVVLVEVTPRAGADPVADVRALCRAGYRVLALSTNPDPYLSASLLGTGACLLQGRKQTLRAIIAAIRATSSIGANGSTGSYGSFGANGSTDSARPAAAGGMPRLSERERSVLLAYTSGLTLDAVAEQVGIRPSTAKTYLERVKAKYREIGRPAYTKLELAQRASEDRGCGAH